MTEYITSGPRRLSIRRIHHGADLPWVVFSNSLLTDKLLWADQIRALGDGYNIVLYDQYGHDKSPLVTGTTPAALTFDDLADDLLAVIAATGAAQVAVVGVSMGVPTALKAFARKPDAFAKLVLINGQTATPPEAQAMWDSRIEQAAADFDGFCNATMRRWLGRAAADSIAGQSLLQMMTATPFEGFASCARALGSFDATAALGLLDDPAYSVPVLAVAGLNDTALATHMADVFSTRARFVGIADAGHLPSYERPEVFNPLLLDFLRG